MRIAFLVEGGNDTFLKPIATRLSRKYEVVQANLTDITQAEQQDHAQRLLDWADLAWVEWVQAAAIHISRMKRRGRLVMRLHSFEAYTAMPSLVHWEHVDGLMLVAPHVRDILVHATPNLEKRVATYYLPNGVDLDRFTFKKDFTPTGKVAFAAAPRPVKNLPLMLQCFHALRKAGLAKTLHCAGTFSGGELERNELAVYLEHIIGSMGLTGKVAFEGHVADMNGWLDDKDLLISASIRESFGYNIAEAMAKGVRPLIHHFPGAKAIFPHNLIFDAVEQCTAIAASPKPHPAMLRRFIEDNYTFDAQMAALDSILQAVSAKEPRRPAPVEFSSKNYWEQRYASGGTSGAGSKGRLAAFKADVLNEFVHQESIRTVVEFGCGDGDQLSLAAYPAYLGLDVSESALARCRARFADDDAKRFAAYEPGADVGIHDAALSLDVVYHLVEDAVFEAYMNDLFDSAARWVVVYASNKDERPAPAEGAPHVRHRRFTDWVAGHRPEWKLVRTVENPYPHNPAASGEDTSFADFYFFKRTGA